MLAALRATSWPTMSPTLSELPHAGSLEWHRDRCHNIDADDVQRCTYGNRQGSRTAVLLGDSVTTSYLPAIRAALSQEWRIVPLTREACPFVDLPTDRETDEPYDACYAQRAYAVAQVKRLQPDLVVVSGQATTFAGRIIGRPREASANVSSWRSGTQRLLAQVAPHTDRLVLVGGPPGGKSLRTCATGRTPVPSRCVSALDATWRALAGAERTATARAGGTYVDPSPWLCAGGRCPAVIGSTPVYYDGRHLTRAFSQSLAPRLRPVLTAGTSP